MKRLLILILIVFQANILLAQKTKKILKMADTHFQYKEYLHATPMYLDVLSQEPNHPDKIHIQYKIGYGYLHSNKDKALPYLQKVFDQNPKYDPMIEYYLANAYQASHQFNKASEHYEAFAKKVNDPAIKKDVQKKIKECYFGKKYRLNPVKASIHNIGSAINTEYPEYVPVISADESVLIFTARRPDSNGGGHDVDGMFFEDVYISEKKDGKWSKAKNIGSKINAKYHDASIGLSPDGNILFVYKLGKNKMGDIYMSKKQSATEWSAPKSLGDHINTKYREPSASITPDGKTLYFSSDRPGGFGGLDIYKSEKDDRGKWSKPTNLGPTINTAFDEDSPFIHDNETLYFSSCGHSTMGGYDIFVTQIKGSKWSEPTNLGYPINTSNDDIYFVLSADNKTGYYASSKEGGKGEKDIYSIDMPQYKDIEYKNTLSIIKPNIAVTKVKVNTINKKPITILQGLITDKSNGKKLDAEITLVDLAEDQVTDELSSKDPIGEYKAVMNAGKNYLITVHKEGYLFHSEHFNIPPSTGYQEIRQDVQLQPIKVGAFINLKVFYDFDKDILRPESKTELNRLLQLLRKHPTLKVEISGHTDAIGTDQKNLDLSQRRAASVVQYLTKGGIQPNRLVPKGYGESKPIATNETDQGRQLNRRTECVILQK